MIPIYLLDTEPVIVNRHGIILSGLPNEVFSFKRKKAELIVILYKYKGYYYLDFSITLHYSGYGYGPNTRDAFRSRSDALQYSIHEAIEWSSHNKDKGHEDLIKIIKDYANKVGIITDEL